MSLMCWWVVVINICGGDGRRLRRQLEVEEITDTHIVCHYRGWPSLLIVTKRGLNGGVRGLNDGSMASVQVCFVFGWLLTDWSIDLPFLWDSTICVFGCESSDLVINPCRCHYTSPLLHNGFTRFVAFRLHRSSMMLILQILWFWFCFFSFSFSFLIFGWNEPL